MLEVELFAFNHVFFLFLFFLAVPLSKNAATLAAYLTWCQLVWSQL